MSPVLVTCPPTPALAAPAPDRPRYVVTVNVAPSLQTVRGAVDVTFKPNRPTNKLVFRLWPNAPRSRGESVRLDVGAVRGFSTSRPDPTTLVVRLGRSTTRSVRVRIPWTLHVGYRGFDRIARFPGGGVLLGSFFPILAWDPRRGWVTDPPADILAEYSTAPVAEFSVRVHAPPGLTAVVSDGHAVRDVAVAVGRFAFAAATVRRVHVRVAVARGGTASPKTILAMATSALTRLSQRYGAYPWAHYTVVIPPRFGSGGIEYPTLSFVGHSARYDRLVVDHETAHQWFYSLVGNDQARDPWLDETLATWGQVRLGSAEPPPARAVPKFADSHVGAPLAYWQHERRWYFYGVYGAGVKALHSLGHDDAVDCALRHYVARRAYSIAQPGDLLDQLNRFIPGAERRLRPWGIHR
jgi:hypothetical protein